MDDIIVFLASFRLFTRGYFKPLKIKVSCFKINTIITSKIIIQKDFLGRFFQGG